MPLQVVERNMLSSSPIDPRRAKAILTCQVCHCGYSSKTSRKKSSGRDTETKEMCVRPTLVRMSCKMWETPLTTKTAGLPAWAGAFLGTRGRQVGRIAVLCTPFGDVPTFACTRKLR